MWYTIKNYIRFLRRNKTVSFINLAGFSISMTVLFVLVAFIVGERSVNSDFPNKTTIYRIYKSNTTSTSSIVPITLKEDVKAAIPEVDKFGVYSFWKRIYKYENKVGVADLAAINDDFLSIFSMDYVVKSTQSLEVKNHVILTQSFSNRLFGDENPIGKTLFISDSPFTITGIIKDVPKNASFHFDIATSYRDMSPSSYTFQTSSGTIEEHSLINSIIQLNTADSENFVSDKISNMLIDRWEAFKDNKLYIEPLEDVYFNAIDSDQMKHANVKLIYLLVSIAMLITFMAIFNYINLTISSSYNRLKEIGVKRTAGASKKSIFIQLLTESIVTSIFSMVIAAVLSFAFIDLFSNLLGKELPLYSIVNQPLFLLTIFSIIVLTGLTGGIYPAYVFSKFSPIKLIHKTGKIKKQNSGRWVLAFQFVVSMVLVASLFFIQKQLHFIQYKNLGFNKEQLIKLNLTRTTAPKWNVIKAELLKYPNITAVAASSGTVMQTAGWSRGNYLVGGEKKAIETKHISVDEDFLQTFKIKLLKGRDFKSSDSAKVCLINEHLYNELEWKNLEGKTFGNKSVVGVVADFHYSSLHSPIGNLVLGSYKYYRTLSIKTTKDIATTLKNIKEVCNKFEPGVTPEITFYDEWIESMYQKEKAQFKAIVMFAVIAIIIACLGLFGITILISLRKTKEIGVRKINGASNIDVILMLNREFIFIISASFLVAIPITYYIINKWLENFAYKTDLSWWVFALAGLAVLVVALFTVSWQSYRAASRNPVEALRYE